MQMKNWSILGPVASEHHLLGVFHHIRIVSHVHVLQCGFIGQLREIPNGDGRIFQRKYFTNDYKILQFTPVLPMALLTRTVPSLLKARLEMMLL